jgi:hypothetical protein
LGLFFAATLAPAVAFDLLSVQTAAGVWELSEGARKCAIRLLAEPAGKGNALGMPVGCRHSMAAIAAATNWTLDDGDRIVLADRTGTAVLSFAAGSGALMATGPKGETYSLTSAADAKQPPRAGSKFEVAQVQPKPALAPAVAVSHGPPVPAAEIPGRYSVLRDATKDTGCMLTLNPGGRAQLAPACRDNGFVIFDPQTWSYAGGKLRLTARKGHAAAFEHGIDGTWQKDPKEGGKPLGFRKM